MAGKGKGNYDTLVNVETTRLKGQGLDKDKAGKDAKKTVDEHFGIKKKKKTK